LSFIDDRNVVPLDGLFNPWVVEKRHSIVTLELLHDPLGIKVFLLGSVLKTEGKTD
jgi:hypothetical protein